MARNIQEEAIPEGWKYDLLDKFATRCSGHTPSKSYPEYWDGGIKWISLTDSHRLDNGYIHATDKEISLEGIKNSSAELHPAETVVLSRDAGIGKSGVMAVPMAVSQHFIAWKCDNSEKLNSWFLYNWLQLNKAEFERQAVGSTIKTIGLPYFKKLKIAVPPYPEQKKIAQILSNWDKGITTTKQRLANSQQQKKALMQQLLTGKQRLLDQNGERFEGEWESKPLSNLGEVVGGLTYSPSDVTDESGTLVLRSSNVQNGQLAFDDNVYVTCTAPEKSVTRENDILLCVRNGSRALIGKSALLTGQAVGCFHGAFMSIFRAKEPLYIFQLFQSSLFYREVRKNLGATINSINGSDLKKFTFKVPADKAERDKIAAVLSAADQEITTIQQQLDHLKQEKKALMQQLLTGKRRVQIN